MVQRTASHIEHVNTLELPFEEHKRQITTAECQLLGNPGGPRPSKDRQNREGLISGGYSQHVTDDDNNKHTPHERIPENYGQP